MSVVHPLYLYDLHIVRQPFQLVVCVVVCFCHLVEHVQMVVRVAYPKVSVLVLNDVSHFLWRYIIQMARSCRIRGELGTVE